MASSLFLLLQNPAFHLILATTVVIKHQNKCYKNIFEHFINPWNALNTADDICNKVPSMVCVLKHSHDPLVQTKYSLYQSLIKDLLKFVLANCLLIRTSL